MKYTILLAGGAILIFGWLTSMPFSTSAEPGEPERVAIPESPEEIRIRYAEVNLALAKVELQAMLETNQKDARAYPRELIDRKKADVIVAQQLLQVARSWQVNGDVVPVHLIRARADAELAKRKYKRALESKKRDLVYTDLQLEQMRLNVELSRVRLAMWAEPQENMTLLQHSHWQVERLSEQVLQLQKKVGRLNTRLALYSIGYEPL